VNIVLDIETIPVQRDDLRADLAAAVKPPATLKKAESIAAWQKDERPTAEAEAVARSSFDGAYGQVCCIGWAIDDEPPQSLVVDNLSAEEEGRILASWFTAIRAAHNLSGTAGRRPTFIGFNHISFDLPFLWKRAVVHNVKPPIWWPNDAKPWSDHVYDCMVAWAGPKDRISMDRLCKVLGIPGKSGVSGADVWPMAQEGQWSEIAAYCRDDVARTRAIHRRLAFVEA
jgi:hypothetical protein